MRITRTANEIVAIINETVGMDICYADGVDDIKIETKNDAEGNEIRFDDYLFCGDSFYHYVNQQGMVDDLLNITLNSYPLDEDENYNDKCINEDGKHDDYCSFSVNIDDIGVWTFDEETFNNVLEGLKNVLKVTKSSKFTISNEVEFMDI